MSAFLTTRVSGDTWAAVTRKCLRLGVTITCEWTPKDIMLEHSCWVAFGVRTNSGVTVMLQYQPMAEIVTIYEYSEDFAL